MPRAKSSSKKAGGRGPPKKRPSSSSESSADENRASPPPPPAKKAKVAAGKTGKPLANKASTDYDKIDFAATNVKASSSGERWNFKISSWNVDGLRAWCQKGGLEFLERERPDVLCLQETKCSEAKLPEDVKNAPGDYRRYWASADKEGYSGVGMYAKREPLSVSYGLGNEDREPEGRIITAEFDAFYVISVYVPNAGRGLVTLPKRLEWNAKFREHVKRLDARKPVVVCGDMNVSHLEIDLANPKTNKKNAGFTQEERDGMTEFLGDGYIDTFRKLYPNETGRYTFWTYMMNCRAKNIGWRLDYAIVSERLMPSVCDNVIRSEVYGSDHCPITLFLHVKD